MLLPIGKKPAAPTDLVGALAQCHERIRFFADLALAIARRPDAPPDEIAAAAARVRRYFAEALPLHVADEDETLAPLLAGRDGAVDAALAEMQAEHETHAPLLVELIAGMDRIADEPRVIAIWATALAPLATRIRGELEQHLTREETVIFPAIARLPDDLRQRARAAIRARRDQRSEGGVRGMMMT